MSHLEPSSKIVVAEISLVPLVRGKVSMSDEIAIAFLATLTGMGTQVESSNLKCILTAVEAAHEAVGKVGAYRIITTIRIDQRFDKIHTLKDRVQNVKGKLYGH